MATNWCIQKGVICDRVAASGYCSQSACTRTFQMRPICQTNADHIRAMNDEELASFLCDFLTSCEPEHLTGYNSQRRRNDMNYQLLIEHLKECGTYGFKQEECTAAATAITDLLARAETAEAQLNKVRRILSDPLIVCGENNTLRPVKRTSRQDVYTTVLKAQKAARVTERWFPKEWDGK